MDEEIPPFEGFGDQAITFWNELEHHNNRAFFTSHRDVYERHVREPLERLLAEVGAEFGDGKVFRAHRDVRFSHDKSPYKLVGAAAIGDDGASSTVYYVQVSARGLFVASGIYLMTRDQLQRFYAAIDADGSGSELAGLVTRSRSEGLQVGGSVLKNGPRGYAKDHPRIELLRHKSLVVTQDFGPGQEWLYTPAARDRIVAAWRAAAPVNAWLATHVGHPQEP